MAAVAVGVLGALLLGVGMCLTMVFSQMAKSKLVKANEKIAEAVVDSYKKLEGGAVGGYKKVEESVVGGFDKITDKFVGEFLTHEGESVEEARARLAAEETERREATRAKTGRKTS